MRKIIILVLTATLLLAFAQPICAAGSVSLGVSSSSIYRGDTVTVFVSVSNVGSGKDGGIDVSFGSGLELISGEWLLPGKTIMAEFGVVEKDGVFVYDSGTSLSGKIFQMTFKAKANASLSSHKVSVKVRVDSQNMTGSTSIKVACKHSFGSSSKLDGTYHQRTCSICKYVEKNKHNYDNGCDSKCNTCGATRSVSHQFKTEWSSTDKYHYHACKICGDWSDTAQHTPGAAATEQAAQTCTVCNRVLSDKLEHVHDKLPDIQMDETGHWYNCTKCEDKADFQEHTYEFACSDTCTTCGYKREVTHTPGTEIKSDETGHWYDCQVCHDKADFQEHTGDSTSQNPVCEVCGYAMVHYHSYSDTWTGDDIFHWHACACGVKKGEESHSWNEGEVIREATWFQMGKTMFTCGGCQATMEVTTMPTLPTIFPWMVACGVLAIGFLAMGIVLIVIISKTKGRQKGKYTAV